MSESRARERAGIGAEDDDGHSVSKVSWLSAGIPVLIGCQGLLFLRVSFYTIQLNVSFWLVIVGGKMYCLPLNVFLKGEQSQSFVVFLSHPGSGAWPGRALAAPRGICTGVKGGLGRDGAAQPYTKQRHEHPKAITAGDAAPCSIGSHQLGDAVCTLRIYQSGVLD